MMEKFTADEKVAIVMESFTANNIAELCRRHGVSVSNFYKWRLWQSLTVCNKSKFVMAGLEILDLQYNSPDNNCGV